MIPIGTSTHRRTIPPIHPTKRVILTPSSYATWTAMLAANPDVLDYLITPGDYTSWGTMTLGSTRPGGTWQRPKTVRYYNHGTDESVHPVDRPDSQAKIYSINVSTPSHWFFSGLQTNFAAFVQGGSTYITWDRMLIQDYPGTSYGIRFRTCSYCQIQDSVIRRGGIVPGSDCVGIDIKPDGAEILGLKIIDCEVYDAADCIQITDDGTDPSTTGVEFLIEGCDLYLTSDRYLADGTRSSAENAIDIKTGHSTRLSYIRGNRMWGFRNTDSTVGGTGSAGDVIVFNNYCQNVIVEDNIIADAPCGIRDENWKAPIPTETPRNCIIRNNHFVDIRRRYTTDTGVAIQPVNNIQVYGNTFSDCDYVYRNISPYRAGGPTFTNNRRFSTPQYPSTSVTKTSYVDSLNSARGGPRTKYARKRWTGQEIVYGPRAGKRISAREM